MNVDFFFFVFLILKYIYMISHTHTLYNIHKKISTVIFIWILNENIGSWKRVKQNIQYIKEFEK